MGVVKEEEKNDGVERVKRTIGSGGNEVRMLAEGAVVLKKWGSPPERFEEAEEGWWWRGR